MAKDYKKIAASKIRKPGQNMPRILVYARNKKGKTHFCSTAPNVLIVDPEGGADYLSENVDVWPVEGWEDIDEVLNYLKTSEGRERFKWVALDGMTRIQNMALKFVMKKAEEQDLTRQPGMVSQRDYGKAGELIKGMLYSYHSLPQGIIYTAQERQDDGGAVFDEDEDVESADIRYVPDLPKGIRNSINGIVDVIGRIYTVRVDHPKEDSQVTVRRMWLSPVEQLDTGGRSQYKLPDYLKKPTVPRLIETLETGGTK